MRLKNHTKKALEAGNLRVRPGDPVDVTDEQLAEHSKLAEFRAWLSKGDLSLLPECHEKEIEARDGMAKAEATLKHALADKQRLDADEKATEDEREAAWKALAPAKEAVARAQAALDAVLHPKE